jgi:stearoyl-CoA desaturase (delta-9 desaturase)
MQILKRESFNYYLYFNIPLQILAMLSFLFVSNWYVVSLTFIVSYILIYWIGVQAGAHKLFAHRSWEPKNNLIKYTLAIISCLGLMGGPIVWAQIHRYHHIHSDTDLDPHSPAHGIMHSYFLWLFKLPEISMLVIKDLLRDKLLIEINKHCKNIVIIILGILFFINFNIFVGTLLACVITFHSEMIINSFFHRKQGIIKNNKLLSWISGGSTLHKNHHDNTKLSNLKIYGEPRRTNTRTK